MRKIIPQQHEDSRNKILDAARRLFADQGVKETSMSQVAKACRLTKGAIYHYFKSKDEILLGIFEGSLEAQDRFVGSVRREGTTEQTLYRIGRAYLEMIAQPASMEMMKIFQTEGMKNTAVCRRYTEQIQGRMGDYLKLGVERGILPDVDRGLLKNLVFTYFGSLEHHFIHAHILKCEIVESKGEGYPKFLAKMFAHAIEMIQKQEVGADKGRIKETPR
jgi:AcrR family transcriptional regulator